MSDFTGVFYIILWISYTQAEYFVSQDNSTWGGNKTCQLTNRIEFDFSGDKVTVNISDLEIKSKEKIWVGYFRTYTTFTYTGCVSINDVSEQRGQIQIEDSNPGKCFSACTNNRYIGITKDQCHCLGDGFTNTTNDLQVYCDSHCNKPIVACGGNNNGTTYLSVYRTSFNVSDSNKKDTNCLSLDPVSRKYMWMECSGESSSLLGMCAKDNHVFANKPTSYKNWLNTVNECFKNKSRPTDYSNSNGLGVHNGSQFWTGIIKSKAIFTEEFDTPNEGKIEFGYLKRTTGDNYELKFANGDSNKRYICSSVETTAITDGTTLYSQTTILMSSSVEISNNITSPPTPTTTSSLSTPKFSQTDITTDSESIDSTTTKAQQFMAEQKDSNTGVSVGISVAVVFVIAAVITVIVLLKRRGLIPNRCYRKTDPIKSVKPTTDIAAVSNNNYEEVEDSPYDTSNRTATQMGMDNSVDSPEDNGHYAHTYFVLEDNANHSTTENSIAFPSKNLNGTDESNVYNTLNSDIMHKNNVDNTYDTSETALRKLQTQLSKEFDGQKESVFNDRDEDTYNHINGKPHNKNNTDNVYGVNENDYGDIQKRSEKKTDSEDTYNRINLTQFQTNEKV
ncbi:uncharacterized protein LOC132742132 isoform X2 [Ruditapes philippinarum]|uniref:uncharacterized protein LOC132742132 isoform X2 n=1 Tax=Ruditapes philippinarum TaxID=129788 RepID=UPI00295B6D29|nr:uncharacterized protein LOC132742132 isoform X2 [Ruditapes philippinarum]